MVRRGSTVRVRQRASANRLEAGGFSLVGTCIRSGVLGRCDRNVTTAGFEDQFLCGNRPCSLQFCDDVRVGAEEHFEAVARLVGDLCWVDPFREPETREGSATTGSPRSAFGNGRREAAGRGLPSRARGLVCRRRREALPAAPRHGTGRLRPEARLRGSRGAAEPAIAPERLTRDSGCSRLPAA
jgi:hypothetical protein